MDKLILNIEGMSCGHCQNHVKESFANLNGVKEVNVDLENAKATILYDKIEINEDQIKSALDNTTYSIV